MSSAVLQRVVKKKFKQLSEIKFHNSDEKTRTYVLTEIAKKDVKIIVVVIDKEGRKVKDSPLNYGIAVGATISEFLSIYPALNLTVDKKFANDTQESQFLKITQEVIEILGPKNKNIVFNPPADSKKEPRLQLADFVAGAFQAKYNKKNNQYAEIIKNKILEEKVIRWTELKKRIVNP